MFRLLTLLTCLVCGAPILVAQDTDAPISVGQPDIPLTINNPGHYRLAESVLSPADAAAITIAANGVTIDLDGYSIAGPGRESTQPAFAIFADADSRVREITIRNGTIRDFPTSAVSLRDSVHISLHDLRIHGIGEVAIDAGDEATIRGNHISDIGFEDTNRTGAVVGIRAGLNSLVEANTIKTMVHGGNGLLDGIRVDRGCYVVDNRIEDLSTGSFGTGDVSGIACATLAADIRANVVRGITNSRPGGIAIGIRVGSGSAEGNRVGEVSASSLAIGIQGIAAVFMERNEIKGVRTINNGPDAFGIYAAGTGGRIASNTVSDIDCRGDESRNREVGIRANSAFEITRNTIHLPFVRSHTRQAGIEISGIYNTIIENDIRLGDGEGPPGTAILLGNRTSANTVLSNQTEGRTEDRGIGNRSPAMTGGLPAL